MTPEQFYRAAKEIIDRCVAPDMYPMAMDMLKAASKAAVLAEDRGTGHVNAQMAEIGKAKEDK